VVTLLPYKPYYLTYFNPLLGGPLTAPKLVKIGWGEGLDVVGSWLESQPNPASIRVGSTYASTIAPYFSGDIADGTSSRLDYVVTYLKDEQSGIPAPEVVAYYQHQPPLYQVDLAGIDYASVYAGPAAQLVTDLPTAGAAVVAFRSQSGFAPIGQEWIVDLIWRGGPVVWEIAPTLSLRLGENEVVSTQRYMEIADDESLVYRYQVMLPTDLSPGRYALYFDSRLLGEVEARYDELPAGFTATAANFGNQIDLIGFNPEPPVGNDTLTVQLALRAAPKAWADYTIFVHLIDEADERLTGSDLQPVPPSSQWLKEEVVLVTFPLSLPPDLSTAKHYRLRIGAYHPETFEPLGEPAVLPLDAPLGE
jgi:hypothetical protein